MNKIIVREICCIMGSSNIDRHQVLEDRGFTYVGSGAYYSSYYSRPRPDLKLITHTIISKFDDIAKENVKSITQ